MPLPSEILIRKYSPQDRDAVRSLCCLTGFLGKPIDPVFEDRELFSDYLTRYYTDEEPESSFVMEQGGVVKGYLLGSRFPWKHQLFSLSQNLRLFFRALTRYQNYNERTREFIYWILKNSWREVPAVPRRTAHFHFNLLPEVQSWRGTLTLLNTYFDYLSSVGETAVFGQIVTFQSRRGAALFERYGFRILEKREITKYKKLYPEKVYLTTVIRQLPCRLGYIDNI